MNFRALLIGCSDFYYNKYHKYSKWEIIEINPNFQRNLKYNIFPKKDIKKDSAGNLTYYNHVQKA